MSATQVGLSRGAVLAIAAHADDIEFMMAGTVCLLVERGWDAHCLVLANGYLGTATHSPERIVLERSAEAAEGAKVIGATWHPSLVNDSEIIYSMNLVRQVTALIREVRPSIVLTQPLDDYMEDHIQTSRIVATAAFNRNMPNFQVFPPRAAYSDDITIYHAQPHGLRDGLRRLVFPGLYVDVTTVFSLKTSALAAHKSQAAWLDDAQGFTTPAAAMEQMSRTVGRMSGKYEFAEGWRRHSHLGFSAQDIDPLTAALSNLSHVDEEYESLLSVRSRSFD